MPCIELKRSQQPAALALAALFVAGCAQQAPAPAPPPPAPAPVAAPAPPPAPVAAAPAAKPPAAAPGKVSLPPPAVSRNWDEFKKQAARRMVAASPDGSYTSKAQPMLLGVPVIQIELNADGSVKSTTVLREASAAKETTKLAIDAIYRAAPYGDVSKLPKPWQFVEAFLFNDDKRFKPRTLE